jgi:hypothetical protein
MVVQNATTSINVLSSVASVSPWAITTIVFFVILSTLFVLSKNFRHFLYGAVIITVLTVVYKISRYIGVSTAVEHNYIPIKWFIYIVLFIVISIVIGKIITKLPIVKRWEDENA